MNKFFIFVKKNSKTNMIKIKNITKIGILANIQGDIEMLHIAFLT